MEEIDLIELFNMFWNKKMHILIIVILSAIIGAAYSIGFVTPKYTSSTTLVLATNNNGANANDNNSITTTEVNLNSKLVSTYSELVKSKNVLREVINNLDINIGEGQLRSNVSVNAVKDTEFIEIKVTNENATYAAKIANEIAQVFSKKVTEIYNISNVHIVDEAEVSSSPSNVNHMKDVIIFVFVGLVISVLYIIVLNMLDNTIKSTDNIEKEFGVPVLVSMPMDDIENKKVR